MSRRRLKVKANNWKNKAIARGKENRSLRKQNAELIKSRDTWKEKYKNLKRQEASPKFLSGKKAKHHQYDLLIVLLAISLYKYGGMTLRSCRHSLYVMCSSLGLYHHVPCHSTLRNWVCKCGMYRVRGQAVKPIGFQILKRHTP